jgi:5'(3')-deoxyribonucleotidase
LEGNALKIAFDVDDVLCDMFPSWVAEMNRRYGLSIPVDHWPAYNPWEQFGVTEKQAWDSLVPKLYDTSPPFPGAREVVDSVRAMGHTVVFLTTCPDAWHYHRKLTWLSEHGFSRNDLEVVPIGEAFQLKHKDQCPTDYLLDDHVLNVAYRPGGILLNRPHNRSVRFYGRRVDSLREFANHIWQAPALCDARALAEYMSVGGSDF